MLHADTEARPERLRRHAASSVPGSRGTACAGAACARISRCTAHPACAGSARSAARCSRGPSRSVRARRTARGHKKERAQEPRGEPSGLPRCRKPLHPPFACHEPSMGKQHAAPTDAHIPQEIALARGPVIPNVSRAPGFRQGAVAHRDEVGTRSGLRARSQTAPRVRVLGEARLAGAGAVGFAHTVQAGDHGVVVAGLIHAGLARRPADLRRAFRRARVAGKQLDHGADLVLPAVGRRAAGAETHARDLVVGQRRTGRPGRGARRVGLAAGGRSTWVALHAVATGGFRVAHVARAALRVARAGTARGDRSRIGDSACRTAIARIGDSACRTAIAGIGDSACRTAVAGIGQRRARGVGGRATTSDREEGYQKRTPSSRRAHVVRGILPSRAARYAHRAPRKTSAPERRSGTRCAKAAVASGASSLARLARALRLGVPGRGRFSCARSSSSIVCSASSCSPTR